jgi:hypothetical protein
VHHAHLVTVAFAAVTLLGGCKAEGPDLDDPPQLKAVEFSGKIEPRFVGTWSDSSGHSILRLDKDGALNVINIRGTPSGTSKAQFTGSWLVSGDRLLLQYTVPGRPKATLEFNSALAGDRLTLVQGNRVKTVYKRSK